MSEKKQNLEAEPYIRVEFNLEREHGTGTIHEADCGIRTVISGLKEDLNHVFGLPAHNQQWFYNQKQLEDSKTLQDYEITGTDQQKPTIHVKRI